jgi:phosphoribosylaminoimidazolecarboxamide formyltransferase/IMP cyclohydrolase
MMRGRVVHLLLCPAVEGAALPALQRRASLRVLANPALREVHAPIGREWRTVRGGLLVQEPYGGRLEPERLRVVTAKRPSEDAWEDIRLAWGLATATRSNAVVLVKDGMLLGAGAGQQDRLSGCRLAVAKAGERAHGAVAASDGSFPFARGDAVEALTEAGVAIVVQPGGARRDQEAIDLCDERGVAMLFTGVRGFRH